MKKEIVVLTLALTFGAVGLVCAEVMQAPDMAAEATQEATAMATDATDMAADSAATTIEAVGEMQDIEVNNKICPIDMKEIGSMGEPASLSYNGKIYKICCPACLDEFNKDPAKYSENFAQVEPVEEIIEKTGEMTGEMQEMDGSMAEPPQENAAPMVP